MVEPAAKADTIAHRTLRTIHERWAEDPAFYEKFSKMLEAAIEAFRKEWISAAEYLKQAASIMESVRNRTGDEIPDELQREDVAKALYGVIRRIVERYTADGANASRVSAEAALKMDRVLEKLRITNWTTNSDRQNQMRTEMEDVLFEIKDRHGFELSFEDIDKIMDDCIDVFKVRRP